MEGRAAPSLGCPAPKSLHRLCHYLQIPLPSLYTINSGCGARCRSAPFIFKLSKLLLAFQLSISYRVVVQQWSRARAELLGVWKSLLGLVQLLCNSFISALLYLVFISVLYSSIACFTLSTQSLVFVISELRCLLFGISSICYHQQSFISTGSTVRLGCFDPISSELESKQ